MAEVAITNATEYHKGAECITFDIGEGSKNLRLIIRNKKGRKVREFYGIHPDDIGESYRFEDKGHTLEIIGQGKRSFKVQLAQWGINSRHEEV